MVAEWGGNRGKQTELDVPNPEVGLGVLEGHLGAGTCDPRPKTYSCDGIEAVTPSRYFPSEGCIPVSPSRRIPLLQSRCDGFSAGALDRESRGRGEPVTSSVGFVLDSLSLRSMGVST